MEIWTDLRQSNNAGWEGHKQKGDQGDCDRDQGVLLFGSRFLGSLGSWSLVASSASKVGRAKPRERAFHASSPRSQGLSNGFARVKASEGSVVFCPLSSCGLSISKRIATDDRFCSSCL